MTSTLAEKNRNFSPSISRQICVNDEGKVEWVKTISLVNLDPNMFFAEWAFPHVILSLLRAFVWEMRGKRGAAAAKAGKYVFSQRIKLSCVDFLFRRIFELCFKCGRFVSPLFLLFSASKRTE